MIEIKKGKLKDKEMEKLNKKASVDKFEMIKI